MSFYEPVHGDQINGSPATLNRYITAILASGAHFQFIDGETIEVIVPGTGQAVVTTLGDTVVAAKPEPEAEVAAEVIQEIVEEAVEHAAEAEEVEDKPAPARRGRKPKAEEAPVEEGE